MVETVAFPGENITNTLIEKEDIIIGPGLSQGIFNEIQAHKAGIVREQTNILYLDTSQKRYYPQLQEPVVGVIEGKMGDGYKVDIGASFPAYLDSLSFEGASKRNKPNLVNGSIVYGRITIASRDMDPEMSCIGNSGKAEGLGELSKKGALIQVGLSLARSLMNAENPVLTLIAKLSAFELVIGLNGYVWIKGDSIKTTFHLSDLILRLDRKSPDHQRQLVLEFLKDF